MRSGRLSNLAGLAGAVVVVAAQAFGQQPQQLTPAIQTQPANASHRVIVVSLEDRKLALVEDGQVKKIYTVAVGKPSTPSPEGTFSIQRRVKNPTYHHDGKTVLPGPHNPVGTRWMGLNTHGYGIHGTNVPRSIGKAASHGCIRMSQADLEELYEMVAVGDTVELVGQRSQETAALFGDGEKPETPVHTEPVLTATAATPASAPTQRSQTATTELRSAGVAIPASR